MAYVDVSSLKQYLGTDGTGDDALLSAFIGAAQSAIDRYTRRTFEASADSTKYLDGIQPYVNGRWLHVSEVGDLCAITSVTNGNGVVVSASSYVTEPRNVTSGVEPIRAIKLKDNAAIAWTYTGTPENAIAIVGRWAYSTSAPDDVVQACKLLAAYYYRQKDTGTGDVVAVPEMGTITVPQGMPRAAKVLLHALRKLMK